ncbi:MULTISPECIES: GMC family oxidoreductase N-terminal domain-containing protein [unclassified Mesorhizobium]|uniref:GMC family oxidoreductase n=1 Tax=unclassified Mesorhizobium TaxID=325217 RepID=UPI00112D81AB|nr:MULTISPECIES: GMC family oxidoreductase N-terminal domain-containing protein [unclassified Mesorhizobium]TPJ48165.1 choline dehydrogenase [Mesorhizobium sp. B2-6-6]MCA0002624.1 GMC family oxidoreductase N-terminal domain-containing protein [Mesorhizobium sp. B264B2A]MCA0005852.1 GMC family oxidoreductase N-terminal domain-containing protein [Mesorhizobium sp. B264B1B]MCA0019221.1 GMC family oxidoreductase N-terminal domain-containing protein [Mesorhizobium sp. B264B1A]TPK68773.1 choline deh
MQTYDFIIVGSGSAGSVLADKLSASGRFSVLVLEAGGSDRRFYVQMPLGYGKTFFDPTVNWNYKTEPDPGLGGNVDHWPRGKLLGGSSSINAMVWIRGAREDFDDWRDAGNPGWGYDDLLPAFKALEDNEAGADRWRGRGGPLHISDTSDAVHPLTKRYLAAGQQAGLPFNSDFNGAAQEGVGVYQISTRNGRRMSAARAFLRPAMKRANVRVETNALASRILFEGKRAVGIEYLQKGQTKTARAGREITLSAGSINSPQLLQLSGIGPAALLNGFGIPVIHANENVGANLQDHVGINYTFKGRLPTLNQILRPWWGKLMVGMQYILTRSGPLSLSMNHGGGFFRTDPAFSRPNMQLYFQAFSTVIPKSGERPILTPDPWPGFSIGLSNCRPSSRGEIMIRSSNPLDHPKIVANAYSTNADVEEMLAAVKFVRKIASMPAMAEIIAEEVLPGPSITSDADLITDFRKRSGTVYHPVSTCRMGPDPARAVVDPRLKVHGLEGLRVIDASIFPDNITGNTNAASILTGWKGAELVLEDQE